jgi:hypothetical protein
MFKKFIADTGMSKSIRLSFLSYLVAIFLVVIAHCNDIFILAWVLDSLHIFSNPLDALYYVSGMYTTIGSSLNPPGEWQSLSILIAFAGLFAFSISGAGLYTMLGFFIAAKKDSK